MPLALNIGKCTLLGNYRENNEDSIEVKAFPDMTLCIVADGMGGQAAGEIASKRAIEVVPRELRKNLANADGEEQVKQVVRKAVVQANEEIITMGSLDRDLKNMGTTIVMALWRKGRELYVSNLGDSRAYLLRGSSIEQLTIDHSLAWALVENKTISPAEAKEHRFKNVLWKYLGSREVGDGPEVKQVFIRPGDKLLMCTDGLSGVVPDDRLAQVMTEQAESQYCAEYLCQLALDMGSRDNVSGVIVSVTD